jgi:hypothetical protein
MLNESAIITQKVKTSTGWKGELKVYKDPTRDEVVDLTHQLTSDFRKINIGVDANGTVYMWRPEVLDTELEKVKDLGLVWSLYYDADENILGNYHNRFHEGKELSEAALRNALQKLKGLYPDVKTLNGYYERVHDAYFETLIKKYFPNSELEFNTKADEKIKRNIEVGKKNKEAKLATKIEQEDQPQV